MWRCKRPPIPKISQTYPTMMDLRANIPYVKKIQQIHKSHDTPWVLLISATFVISRNTEGFSKFFLIKIVAILTMSAKLATLDLLKIKVFWRNDYEVIIYILDVTNEILSRDSNYIVDIVMWLKFGNSSISIREVIIISILSGFDQKKQFLWGVLLVQVQ